MMRFGLRRPSPALVVAVLALVVALGGTGYAAITLPANSVGNEQLKRRAVTTTKIHHNAVTGSKVKRNTLTGRDIRESSLGEVPAARRADVAGSATTAGTANVANSAHSANTANRANSAGSVDGRIPFLVRLSLGQSQTIAQNGAISLVAECNSAGGEDQARILAATTVVGAILQGSHDDHTGPGDSNTFLNPTTPADNRELVEYSDIPGQMSFEDDIDANYVVAPDGKVLTLGSETTALGLNYSGATCFIAGIVDSIG
jgi:hypothetical protein